eukprot:3111003-Amphidinium_carterae.2
MACKYTRLVIPQRFSKQHTESKRWMAKVSKQILVNSYLLRPKARYSTISSGDVSDVVSPVGRREVRVDRVVFSSAPAQFEWPGQQEARHSLLHRCGMSDIGVNLLNRRVVMPAAKGTRAGCLFT